ncbi:zinc-ribbon domain-containing protein [Lachnoclostridium sp. Marseille-P6806]|uniref:zinc-ribbon domain-containing protein n=1 Tax=Lachnoclostridium sp. Marseille-P6806 TaxID=2364793 RepID=UPI00103110BA|nr:zinc-ribbon domain-containing protein [Lachnoclostridium sp. Marseille-P6806]
MAKFCRYCGAQLTPKTKFCSKCGKQIARVQAAKSGDFQTAPVRKEKNGKKKIGVIALVIVLLVSGSCAALYFTFFRGEQFKGKAEQTYEAEQAGTILDYARKLEKAGNYEAAEAVYSLIPKGAGADLIEKEKEKIPPVRVQEDLEKLDKIFGRRAGGEGK